MADRSKKHKTRTAKCQTPSEPESPGINYKGMVEAASSIILSMTPQGKISFMNRFGLEFFGFDETEVLGRFPSETIAPDHFSEVCDADSVRDIIETPDAFTHHTNENIKKDGTRVWISWSNQGLYDERGKLTEILCVGNDVTRLKAVEGELDARRKDLAAIVREKDRKLTTASHHLMWSQNRLMAVDTISTCIIQDCDIPSTIGQVLSKLTALVGTAGAAYLDVPPGARRFSFEDSAACPPMPDLKGAVIDTGEAAPLFRTLIRAFKPCTFKRGRSVSDHKGLDKLMASTGVASGLVAPVHRKNRLNGLIFLYSDTLRQWSPEEEALMAQVGEFLALGLNHLTDRDRLIAQEKFLKTIINGVDIGIFVLQVAVTGSLVFESVNDTYRRLRGLGGHRMNGRAMTYLKALTGPEPLEMLRTHVARCIEEKTTVTFLEETQGNGQVWLTRLNPVLDDTGRVFRIIGTATDITDQKMVQAALVKNQARLKEAQRIAKLGDCERKIHTQELSCSDQLCSIFGWDAARPFLYADFINLVHPGDRDWVEESVGRAVAAKDSYDIEYRIVRADGVEKIVNEIGEVIPDKAGQAFKIACIIQDVTEQRKFKDEIELASKVFDNAVEGVMVTDCDGVIQFVNRGFVDITGYTEAEALGQTPRLLKSDRHDKAFYKAVWETLSRDGHWTGEIWNRRKSGEAYPQRLSITAIANSRGETVRYMSVFSDLTDIRAREEQLRFQANYDALTGLPNRTLLADRIQMAVRRSGRDNRGLALIFLDLDDFKHVNDMLGHAKGDLLLQQFAARLLESIRSQDTVARYGGDEFVILIPDTSEAKVVIRVIKRIQEALKTAFTVDGKSFFMGVSIGVTIGPDDGTAPDVLVANADMAMYRAKEAGKGGYAFFTPELNRQVARRVELEMDLRMGLARQEFLLDFQPKLDIATREICGAEALIRWSHPQKGLVSPLAFIPLAEETGLINDIGEWILGEACAWAKAWAKALGRPFPVAVNISPRQVRDVNLPELVSRMLSHYRLPPSCLALEITESAVMGNLTEAKSMLEKLADMGIAISLDDFGTGFSSLSYLRQLPISTLKIDKSFVDDIPEDPDSSTMVTTIITMARHLKLTTVAEGVETRAQFDFLKQNFCSEVQGYYYSPPLPAERFLEFVIQNGANPHLADATVVKT